MKKDKKLSSFLSLYEVEKAQRSEKDKTLSELVRSNVRAEPKFSILGFLSGVIHSLSVWFFVGCGAYIALLLIVSFIAQDGMKIICISALSPFLAVGSAGAVYFNIQPSFIELESTCLYKPKTVFAGKLLLCGVCDLIAVTLGSALASLLGGSSVKAVVILSILGFVLSACAVLTLCAVFKYKSALVLSFIAVMLIFSAFTLNKVLFETIATFLISFFPYLLLGLCALLSLIVFWTVKNFEYESLVKKYEN